MRDWGLMLGGLAIWAIHFLAVYLVASVAALTPPEDGPAWIAAGLVLTGVCLAVLGLLARRTRLACDASSLATRIGLAGCGIAAIAIVWQTLPLVLNRSG